MMYRSAQDVLSRVRDVTEFLGIDLVGVNQTGIFGNTPLAVVITWGDLEAVERLLEAGAEVNAKIEDGCTALHEAVLFEDVPIVTRLLEAGASGSIRDDECKTPLDLAKRLGNHAIIDLLTNGPS